MFRGNEKRLGAGLLLWTALWMLGCPAWGQDSRKVPISFLPPPLETATYSLGIYDAKSGKLVRRLKEMATQDAFTVGDNGLITSGAGKDDAGKAVPPGKYAARGYAVGASKVEGEDILGNDWANDDENLRIKHVEAISLLPSDDALAVLATMANGGVEVVCLSKLGDGIRWRGKPLNHPGTEAQPPYILAANDEFLSARTGDSSAVYHAANGQVFQGAFSAFMESSGPTSNGKDGTVWKIEEGVLNQYSRQGEKLRRLVSKLDEPTLVAVSASKSSDRLYLLEETVGWQRVRGLSWVETKEEDGKSVSTWQTFFERNIRSSDTVLGLEKGALPVEIGLVANPLATDEPQKIKLGAMFDENGSYLTTADGLRLRRISQRNGLKEVGLAKGKVANSLTFFQTDGAARDEFSIEGAKNMMAFDAGEFDMTADGEKTHTEKAAEPPDL